MATSNTGGLVSCRSVGLTACTLQLLAVVMRGGGVALVQSLQSHMKQAKVFLFVLAECYSLTMLKQFSESEFPMNCNCVA